MSVAKVFLVWGGTSPIITQELTSSVLPVSILTKNL